MSGNIRESLQGGIREAQARLRRPTDVEIMDRFADAGIDYVASVPCSITSGIQSRWQQQAAAGQIKLFNTTHEHNLVGIASGIYLGTGERSLIHMQNSGLPNAGDGIISFADVYKIPILGLVTWRGSNQTDDSEPHQAIGERTERLSRAFVPENIFGSRKGRGILKSIDRGIAAAEAGGVAIIRLSPEAFDKTINPTLPSSVYERDLHKKNIEIVETKGDDTNPIFERGDSPLSRDDAIRKIAHEHEGDAILFANGYTARAAQGVADEIGHFYNVGYMGGTLAIGWGMAMSNPDINVVVVDGDQNAQMSNMQNHLAYDYPPNLQWYILNNGIGASVGVSQSLPLAPWYYDLARVIDTVPDEPNKFHYPRVRGIGKYFDTDEAKEMAERVGPLPAHAQRFKDWVQQRSADRRSEIETMSRYHTQKFRGLGL